MSELEKYIDSYSKFVEILAEVHNCHVYFIRDVNIKGGVNLRNALRKLRRMEKELFKGCQSTTIEAGLMNKQRKQRLREERERLKLIPKKIGRPKKEK